MSDQELVGLYKAVQTRADFVKAMSSDESKIVSPDTATDHVVEVTNEIAYPLSGKAPKTFDVRLALTIEAEDEPAAIQIAEALSPSVRVTHCDAVKGKL